MDNKKLHEEMKRLFDLVNKQKGDPPSYLWIGRELTDEEREWWDNSPTGNTKE